MPEDVLAKPPIDPANPSGTVSVGAPNDYSLAISKDTFVNVPAFV